MKTTVWFLSALALVACGDDDGTVDASTADASMPDTSMPDTSVPDGALTLDVGAPDVGGLDAGPSLEELMRPCRRVSPAGNFDQACDVERALITIPEGTPVPEYDDLFPRTIGITMNGWEWWQQWPGGHSPTFEYEEATDPAIKCSVAAAMRFAAIMQDPPENILRLQEETTWEGRFFNWNDDFSQPDSEGDGTGAVLWAWEWYLIKWISQTNRDGSCYLPTRSLVETAALRCLGRATANDGVIQGCQAP